MVTGGPGREGLTEPYEPPESATKCQDTVCFTWCLKISWHCQWPADNDDNNNNNTWLLLAPYSPVTGYTGYLYTCPMSCSFLHISLNGPLSKFTRCLKNVPLIGVDFMGQVPFLSPSELCQSTEEQSSHDFSSEHRLISRLDAFVTHWVKTVNDWNTKYTAVENGCCFIQ